ncbi:hypothetical protein CRUP_019131 [Coryphaenoides rupestris]|nr:hypothetical protein CRUP_019131 [Coryphaenoides rupestris]
MVSAASGSRMKRFSRVVSELSIAVPWGQIRGKVWGPDQGRPVLCLHGWADNCGSFDTLLPLLPQAMDLSGHGQSSHRPPGVSYYFPSYVADVHRVIKGGNIGGMFTSLYPEMVEALVLLDCYGFLPTDVVIEHFKEDVFDFPMK